jgi:hypothetical protein
MPNSPKRYHAIIFILLALALAACGDQCDAYFYSEAYVRSATVTEAPVVVGLPFTITATVDFFHNTLRDGKDFLITFEITNAPYTCNYPNCQQRVTLLSTNANSQRYTYPFEVILTGPPSNGATQLTYNMDAYQITNKFFSRLQGTIDLSTAQVLTVPALSARYQSIEVANQSLVGLNPGQSALTLVNDTDLPVSLSNPELVGAGDAIQLGQGLDLSPIAPRSERELGLLCADNSAGTTYGVRFEYDFGNGPDLWYNALTCQVPVPTLEVAQGATIIPNAGLFNMQAGTLPFSVSLTNQSPATLANLRLVPADSNAFTLSPLSSARLTPSAPQSTFTVSCAFGSGNNEHQVAFDYNGQAFAFAVNCQAPATTTTNDPLPPLGNDDGGGDGGDDIIRVLPDPNNPDPNNPGGGFIVSVLACLITPAPFPATTGSIDFSLQTTLPAGTGFGGNVSGAGLMPDVTLGGGTLTAITDLPTSGTQSVTITINAAGFGSDLITFVCLGL